MCAQEGVHGLVEVAHPQVLWLELLLALRHHEQLSQSLEGQMDPSHPSGGAADQ